ncbi:MAG: CHASE4 domain-containing protein [Planctomycetota bacterium]
MSLRARILLILAVVVTLFVAVDNLVQRFMVARSFETMEREAARKDGSRIVEAIHGELENLAGKTRELGVWDPTFDFVDSHAADYVSANLGEAGMAEFDVDLLFVVDAEGQVAWGRVLDPKTGEPIRVREFPGESLGRRHPVIVTYFTSIGDKERKRSPDHHGLMMTERGPLLVASHPIRSRSNAEAEPRGWVLMGRFVGEELVAKLSERIRVDFTSWTIENGVLPETELGLIDEITATEEAFMHPTSAELLHVYRTFPDMRGKPTLLLRGDFARKITQRGYETVNYALLSTIGSALLLLFVLLQLLQRHVIRPLSKLTAHAVQVGQTEDTSARLEMQRDDELGLLAGEFDSMLGKLAASRRQLAKTARQAGMSEIASGVMHNVGNALNSVNVAVSVAREQTSKLAVDDLARMVEVLKQHESTLGEFVTSDPRGKHTLPVLESVSQQLGERRDEILTEISSLSEGLEEIVELVAAQQRYAGPVGSGLMERGLLSEAVDEALEMVRGSGALREEVQVVRNFAALPPTPLDHHRLMEAMLQLLRNAAQAMDEGTQEPCLTVGTMQLESGAYAIEVTDTGKGIAEENHKKIFQHGFTTQSEQSGFGLHIAANVAGEMGGKLTLERSAPGAGATFRIELPLDAPGAEVRSAA